MKLPSSRDFLLTPRLLPDVPYAALPLTAKRSENYLVFLSFSTFLFLLDEVSLFRRLLDRDDQRLLLYDDYYDTRLVCNTYLRSEVPNVFANSFKVSSGDRQTAWK